MAKPKAPLTPGRARLRDEMNKTLSAARKLDVIEPGVGDRLADETATAIHAARMRAIKSGP